MKKNVFDKKPADEKLRNKSNTASFEPKIGDIVCHNYVLKEMIGEGSFGKVYLAEHKDNQKQFAVKIEPRSEQEPRLKDTLVNEARIMGELQGEEGFPRMYYFIKNKDQITLVMNLLGETLEDLFDASERKFNKRTLFHLGSQMLCRIQKLHEYKFIHRDLKPENFLVGREEEKDTIYLIDFGLSQKLFNEKGEHLPFSGRCGQVGTARYTSLNSHFGFQQSRRDDLESIGYILVYLGKGTLPWNNLKAKTKEEKKKMIMQLKDSCSSAKLCAGLPKEFKIYIDYVKKLNFADSPDYAYWIKLFQEAEKKLSSQGEPLSWSVNKANLQKIKTNTLNDKFLVEDVEDSEGSNLISRTKHMNFHPKKMSDLSSESDNMRAGSTCKILKQAALDTTTFEYNELTCKTTTFTKNQVPTSSLCENFFEGSRSETLKDKENLESSFDDCCQEELEETSKLNSFMSDLNNSNILTKFKGKRIHKCGD